MNINNKRSVSSSALTRHSYSYWAKISGMKLKQIKIGSYVTMVGEHQVGILCLDQIARAWRKVWNRRQSLSPDASRRSTHHDGAKCFRSTGEVNEISRLQMRENLVEPGITFVEVAGKSNLEFGGIPLGERLKAFHACILRWHPLARLSDFVWS